MPRFGSKLMLANNSKIDQELPRRASMAPAQRLMAYGLSFDFTKPVKSTSQIDTALLARDLNGPLVFGYPKRPAKLGIPGSKVGRSILAHYIHISVARDIPDHKSHYLTCIVQLPPRHHQMPQNKPTSGNPPIFIDYQVTYLPMHLPYRSLRHSRVSRCGGNRSASSASANLKSGM